MTGPLSKLQKRTTEDDFDPSNDPRFARNTEIERLAPRVGPRHADWVGTVYYDPNVFPNEYSLERVTSYFSQNHPKRQYSLRSLTVDELNRVSIAKYPEAEYVFRRRGYASDMEFTGFLKGERSPETTYFKRNAAAVDFQLSTINHLLHPAERHPDDWRVQREFAIKALAGTDPRRAKTVAPLVEWNGMFVPHLLSKGHSNPHFAYSLAWDGMLRRGDDDEFHFSYATSEELRSQLTFERRHAPFLFAGATSMALVAWHIHVLGLLRKAAWQIEFFDGPALNKQFQLEETDKRKALNKIKKDSALDDGGEVRNGFRAALNDAQDELGHAAAGAGYQAVAYGLSTKENLEIAFSGSTYCPPFDFNDKSDAFHPLNWLVPVAIWISELKRRRIAKLHPDLVRCMMFVLSSRPEDESETEQTELWKFSASVRDRLPSCVWEVFSTISEDEDFLKIGAAIQIVYHWTRDLDCPWSVQRMAEGVVVITGPLLDFPISEGVRWSKNARAVWKVASAVSKSERGD